MKTKRSILMLAALVSVGTSPVFAKFIPAEDSPPFRRDQLPIDVDTMSQLSKHISSLCATLTPDSPDAQRTAAQCLALAVALDPINREATDIEEKLTNKEKIDPPSSEVTSVAKTKAWRTQTWLADANAGKDANTLANCLGDVLAKIDPDHPSAENFKAEKGTWTGWVADLSDFEASPKIASNDDEEMPDDESEDEKENSDDEDSDKEAKFHLARTTIQSPLWIHDSIKDKYTLTVASVGLSAHQQPHENKEGEDDDDHDKPRFHYLLPGLDNDKTRPVLYSINRATVPYFEDTFGDLPGDGVVSFTFGKDLNYSIARNDSNLSAAAAALTHACLSGNEATGIVIGIIGEDHKMSNPKNVWELIRLLEDTPPSRIVMPQAMAPLLPGLLTMDKLNFFMKHDIFLASDIDELAKFSKKIADPQTTEVLKQFAKIRAKSPSTIGPFVANPHVLKRLEAISAACPQYASPQILSLVGKGKRPSQLSQEVLAHEIRRALAPLNDAVNFEGRNLREANPEVAQAAHEASRAMLDPIERIVANGDRELYSEAVDLANNARTLARAIKKMSGRGEDWDKGFSDKSARASLDGIRNGLPRINKTISGILGEKIEEAPIKRGRPE